MANDPTSLIKLIRNRFTEIRNLLNGENGKPGFDEVTSAVELYNASFATFRKLREQIIELLARGSQEKVVHHLQYSVQKRDIPNDDSTDLFDQLDMLQNRFAEMEHILNGEPSDSNLAQIAIQFDANIYTFKNLGNQINELLKLASEEEWNRLTFRPWNLFNF